MTAAHLSLFHPGGHSGGVALVVPDAGAGSGSGFTSNIPLSPIGATPASIGATVVAVHVASCRCLTTACPLVSAIRGPGEGVGH